MNSVKIIHTADCHLGSGRTGISNGKSELINTFFRMLELCRTEDIDFLLIAGDLFDNPFTDRETATEIVNGFSMLKNTNIIIVSGNHDCACADSIYDTFSFPDNVTLFTSQLKCVYFPDKNVCIYGAGFTSYHETSSMLSEIKNVSPDTINIGVFHGEVTNSGNTCLYNPISSAQISTSGLDYLALGHIHKRSEIARQGNTFYAYCGCPDGRGFDEEGSKGIYIGSVGKNECLLKYMELSSRKYITETVNVSSCTSSHQAAVLISDYLKEKYNDDFLRNLYHISMKGSISPDIILNINQIEAELENLAIFCQVIDCTVPEVSNLRQLASAPTLKGTFLKKMFDLIDQSPDDETVKLALQLGYRAFEREVKLNDN